jgi:hypothetical protein
MRRFLSWGLLLVFCTVSLACLGCGRKSSEEPAGKKALQWKKSKEEELTGDKADQGE